MPLPSVTEKNPVQMPDGNRDAATVFLNQVVDHPNIEVGDYTYYNDAGMPDDYALRIAPYLFPGAPEKLRIGKFCQIAHGVQFITATANHPMGGLSTYPFGIFNPERLYTYRSEMPRGRDTVIGNDCWLGRGVTLLPGASLGNGVIVSAGAVVQGHVPDYAVVRGNPATVIRMRFSDENIARLNDLAWWDWPAEQINAAMPAIERADIDALAAFKPKT